MTARNQQEVRRLDQLNRATPKIHPLLIGLRRSLFGAGGGNCGRDRFPEDIRRRIDNRIHDVLHRGGGPIFGLRRSTRADQAQAAAEEDKPEKCAHLRNQQHFARGVPTFEPAVRLRGVAQRQLAIETQADHANTSRARHSNSSR